MPAVVEYFIRGSDNQIKLVLTEDGQPISGFWNGLDIWIGNVNIHRTGDGDGVTLDDQAGLLIINPGDLLPAEITALETLPLKCTRVRITVSSPPENDDGAVWGEDHEMIWFNIRDKPTS